MPSNLCDYLKTWVSEYSKTVHAAELYVALDENSEDVRYIMKSGSSWEDFTAQFKDVDNTCSTFNDLLQQCHLWFTDGSWAELDFDLDADWQGLKLFKKPDIPEDLLCD